MEHVEEIDVQIENENMQTEAPKPELEKASFWIRLCAYIVDASIIFTAIFFPYLLAGTPFSLFVLSAIMIVVYLLKDSIKGQSPGKFIFGLVVGMRDDSEKLPSFGRRMLRNLTLSRLTGTRVYRIKRRKTWVTVLLLLAFGALFVLVIMLVPERDAITAEEFTAHMEEWNLTVHDNMHNLPEDTPMGDIETYLRAEASHLAVHVEFIVTSTDAMSRSIYAQTVRSTEHLRAGGASSQTEMGFSNFNRFTQTASGQYFVVSRIGNTVLYAHTLTEHRAELNRMLRAIGY